MRSIRDCPVAVVGGAGFLGSHLVDYLIEKRGCKVLVLDNLTSGRREFVHPQARFEHCDITGDEHYLRAFFYQYGCKYVFNYAAIPYIPISFERPLYVFNVNAFGALKVINAAQEAGCEGILQVSSAEIYGEGPVSLDGIRGDMTYSEMNGQLSEQAPVIPHSSYGAAKAAIDAMVQVRWKEARTPVIALRQFNCVGERETHPYVVPEIISQLDSQRAEAWDADGNQCSIVIGSQIGIIQLGNNSFRDFLYAGDAVKMAVELLERGEFGEVYNLGSEEGVSIYDLAKLVGKVMGFADVKVEKDPERIRPWEIWHLQADNSKIYRAIRTRPQVPFEEALRRTVKYYEDNGRKWVWQ